MKIILSLLFFTLSSLGTFTYANVVKYELIATKNKTNLSGKQEVDFALMINGSIPSPTLEFNEGDDAEITVINKIPDDELSIHWHGILLDPYMDGVPYVNTPPIKSGEKYTFKFRLRQHGTYWYHSHTNVQEQKGVYGALIIHPKEKKIQYDKDLVLVLSDWSDENASMIIKNLKKDGDYYIYKKGTMRSWWGAIQEKQLGSFLQNEWSRMGGMDFSDVGYDAFLINGKQDSQALIAHPGEKIRIRLINAAASTYFYVTLANLPMQVVSMDGIDIEPAHTNKILLGMAETYDILFQIPEHKNFELKIDAQDGTGSASAWIGMGEKVSAGKFSTPDLYGGMDHSAHTQETQNASGPAADNKIVDHSKMDHSKMEEVPVATDVHQVFGVNQARAKQKTEFQENIRRHDVKLVLDGDMERYVWHINGKAIHEDRTLTINENEVVRFTFVNNTMMHHPMHLHGHFFRVLNKHGEYSPLKHTVDVAPHETKVIEFYANEPGEWMLHCHNLYHMKTGMARVVKYSSFQPKKEIAQLQNRDPHRHDHIYTKTSLEAATNHAGAKLNLMNTWNEVELRTELRKEENKNWDTDGDLFYKRWLNQNTHLIAGATLVEKEEAAIAGVGYRLPFLIESKLLIDHKAKIRIDLEKRFQWTKNIYSQVEYTYRKDRKSEFENTLMFQNNWNWSAGLMFTEESAGVGIEVQF